MKIAQLPWASKKKVSLSVCVCVCMCVWCATQLVHGSRADARVQSRIKAVHAPAFGAGDQYIPVHMMEAWSR